jgi:hypothetical protein
MLRQPVSEWPNEWSWLDACELRFMVPMQCQSLFNLRASRGEVDTMSGPSIALDLVFEFVDCSAIIISHRELTASAIGSISFHNY